MLQGEPFDFYYKVCFHIRTYSQTGRRRSSLKNQNKFMSNVAALAICTFIVGIFLALVSGSSTQIFVRSLLIVFILLVGIYKYRFISALSYGHAVAIGASLLVSIIAVGFIIYDGWTVILGATFAAISLLSLLYSKYPSVQRMIDLEPKDNLIRPEANKHKEEK